MQSPQRQVSFLDHLDELRARIVKIIVLIFLSSCFFYAFVDKFLTFLAKPVGRLFFLSPAEAFLAHIHLALLGGFLIAFPFVLYQIWAFVAGGLTEKERKHILFFAPFSFVSFVLGIAFGYFVMVPISLQFLLSFSSASIIPMITVNQYISFLQTFVLAFGVVFELPLVLAFLTKIGIATPEFLKQKRRYAIVLILIASAVLTPPDVISQLLMAVPLIFLYEIGIIFSKMYYRPGVCVTTR